MEGDYNCQWGGGRGKGGTIGMLKSVMRGSGKFIATQPKSSNLSPAPSPPALFLPLIPEMKMYNVHVPGESQSKPNIIHLWFIQFVLTFLMLQSYTCKRFLLLHVFFFIIPFCICISLIFCYKLHVYTSLFLPKFFLFFFIFTFLLLATPFLIIFFFHLYNFFVFF